MLELKAILLTQGMHGMVARLKDWLMHLTLTLNIKTLNLKHSGTLYLQSFLQFLKS